MKIAQVIKAKNLREGMRLFTMDSEGNAVLNRVLSAEPTYDKYWMSVELEGVKGMLDIEAKAKVVVVK